MIFNVDVNLLTLFPTLQSPNEPHNNITCRPTIFFALMLLYFTPHLPLSSHWVDYRVPIIGGGGGYGQHYRGMEILPPQTNYYPHPQQHIQQMWGDWKGVWVVRGMEVWLVNSLLVRGVLELVALMMWAMVDFFVLNTSHNLLNGSNRNNVLCTWVQTYF